MQKAFKPQLCSEGHRSSGQTRCCQSLGLNASPNHLTLFIKETPPQSFSLRSDVMDRGIYGVSESKAMHCLPELPLGGE